MNTPDPLKTSEAIAAIIMGVITNLIVLFGIDLSDAKKGAITGLVSTAVIVGLFFYSAIVRHGRASNAAEILQAKSR